MDKSVGSEILYQTSAAFSSLGNSACAVILPLVILQSTGSVLNAGLLALATGVPQFAAAVIGGTLVDRFAHRTVALIGDVLSAVSVAMLAFFVDHDGTGVSVGVFIAFGIISAIGDVPALTAREAMVSSIAASSKASVSRLVSTREALSAAMTLIGPALAAILLSMLPSYMGLYCVSACSLLAAITTLGLPCSTLTNDEDVPRKAAPSKEFADGIAYLFNERQLRLVTAMGLVAVVFLACVQGIILPQYFNTSDHPSYAGWSLSVIALGMMLGAGIYAATAKRVERTIMLAAGSIVCLAGAWLLAILIMLSQSLPVILSTAVLGIGIGICSSAAGVYTLELSCAKYQGRVLGIQNALAMGTAPMAALATAVCLACFGSSAALIASAGLLTILVPTLIMRTLSGRKDAACICETAGSALDGQEAAWN